MKKQLILFATAAMMMLSGCSEKDVPDNFNGDSSTDKNSYIAVTIATNFADTRAGNSDAENADDGNYEGGLPEENQIKTVRFYFFDSEGKMAKVKRTQSGEMVNYLDLNVVPGTDSSNPGAPNVEKGLNAVLVINTAEGDKRPAKILAVCNRSDRLSNSSADLATVRNTCYDYAAFAENNSQFVMSSAVYATASGQEISAVTIPEECFQDQESGANLNPVVLYVERVVAKVRVKLDSKALETKTITENGHDYTMVALLKDNENGTGTGTDNYLTVDGKQVYAKFLGWNVTAATERSSLSKFINPQWNIFTGWNYAPYFRSYWALNCEEAGTRYMPLIGSEGQYSVAGGRNLGTSYTSMYANENAAANSNFTNGLGRAYPSTVIMAAQLCDAAGKPINAYHWLGQMSVGEESLKTAMLEQLGRIDSKLYAKSVEGTQTVIKEIAEADLKMYTAVEADKATLKPEVTGRYYTYAMLSESGEAKEWYSTPECTPESKMDKKAVNSFLNSTLGAAEIWNNGYTYYYFPIRHLGDKLDNGNEGYYGVVRNHIYQVNINKVVGMGTPVYNPGETIIPEKPDNSDTFVSAKINILSWRLVHNDVELDWSVK